VPCFPALCSTALSQAAKRFPLHRCILASQRANTLVQCAERLDFELAQRRMVESRDEHYAHRVALVPHLMLEGIVEDEAMSLTPRALFIPHANEAALGHDKAEVGGEEYIGDTAVRRDVSSGAQRRELGRHGLAEFTAEPSLQELDCLRAGRCCGWLMQVIDRPAVGTFFEAELFLSIARVGALGVRSKSDLCLEETSELGTDDRISSLEFSHPRNGAIVEGLRFESGPKVKLGIL